ncbi:MAG: SusF/SusE family outer membrane protein [Dysgonamonadaceae bacterium]|jgi:hypothetical protein|nr:SusF/SusE family outer membrane protein [Dysgonamonadaceae bacterium]
MKQNTIFTTIARRLLPAVFAIGMPVCGAFVTTGCSEKDAAPALSEIEASALDPLPVEAIVLNLPEKGKNPFLLTVTWTETKFYLDGKWSSVGPVIYNLEIDRKANHFSDPVVLAASPDPAVDLYVNDVNKILLDYFKAEAKTEMEMELRLVTVYGNMKEENKVVSSNTIPVAFTPFEPPIELTPVYMIGTMNEWNNRNKDFMMFRDNSDADNYEYVYTGRMAANTSFKFCPENKLGTNEMYCKDSNGKIVLQDNAEMQFDIPEAGYYTIKINIWDLTCAIEPFDASAAVEWPVICFVGAFCNWGANGLDPEMNRSTYDPHIWSLTIDLDNIDYGVKFRANHDWGTRWCPEIPGNNPYGKAVFNPSADPNIDIAKQGLGHYFVKFNDLTSHYIVMKLN